MKGRKILTQLAAVAALAVLVAAPALAAPQSLATVHAGASSVEWQPAVANVGLALTVSGPQGFYLRQEFKPGESATFSVYDKAGQLRPAGSYSWELTPIVQLDSATAGDLQAARDAAPGTAGTLQKAAKLPNVPKLQSGSFTVADQAIVAGGETEPGTSKPARPAGNSLSAKDQVIADDLIVQGSECVGQDCVNNENFGFDTLRLKENNLRIKFEDTSNSGSFPTTDWQLTANDSTNGGADYFSIDDITDGKTPFKVLGNAPTNSIYVNSSGNVGLGTSSPVVELHIADGDTPTLRLEQNNSSGFAAQTWDVAGNETNFFVRDTTNGSKIPFKIIPGAPTNSLYVNNAGNIGVGTSSPSEKVHVVGSDSPEILIQDTTDNSNDKPGLVLRSPASVNGGDWRFETDNAGNFQIDYGPSTGAEFLITDTTGSTNGAVTIAGDLTVNGVFSNPSSRTLKEGFEPVDTRKVLTKVMGLPMNTWIYKKDVQHRRHMGPIAEDFQSTFGLGTDANGKHIYPIDVQGVTMAAVQGLQHELTDVVTKKDQQIQDLQQRLAELEKLVNQLSQKE